ncbi:MAG: ATP-binding protein [Bryobacterales bacterium]|nr:ATP-binding protein [Bryobacteraceae bacterium]MDW8355007.1 ATP-binding protein [Bryobacterales bacterium]
MAARLFLKLAAVLLGLVGAAAVGVDLAVSRIAESSYVDTVAERLELEARTLARAANSNPQLLSQREIARLAEPLRARLTAIARDGTVLADSEGDPKKMENHRGRPEVAQALAGRTGRVIRQSPTVGYPFLYVAIPAGDFVLRVAAPLAEIEGRIQAIRLRLIGAIALAFLPLAAVAAVLARRTAKQMARVIEFSSELARGNFHAQLQEQGSSEFRLLIRQLNETGRKLQAAAEELERDRAELEKLERVRKDFVINVSHELRTPVASIQGYAETLLDGALEDARHNRRFLEIIRQNAERLGRLTEDLLTLSRLELKSRHFQFATYRLASLLADAADAMRPMADKKGVKVEVEPVSTHLEVFCDAQAFHQILGNLLDNAIKYSPPGAVVTVGAGRLQQEPVVEIWVRDRGPGIPEEDLPRIFERFYRVDKARSRELGGTGLGLAIVKHLVLAHGGTVRVESEVGKGSTFYFTLPMDAPAGTLREVFHGDFMRS